MRRAIYYEIYQNHIAVGGFLDNHEREGFPPKQTVIIFRSFVKHAIRRECYLHYLSNNADLLYQLKEASQIHIIYSHLSGAVEISENTNKESIRIGIRGYLDIVQYSLSKNLLNRRMMESAIGKKHMNDLVNH
jgi:hypothetical protein